MNNCDYSISVVVPLYNEEACIQELHQRISKVMNVISHEYEIIFIKNVLKGTNDIRGVLKKIPQQMHSKCFLTLLI